MALLLLLLLALLAGCAWPLAANVDSTGGAWTTEPTAAPETTAGTTAAIPSETAPTETAPAETQPPTTEPPLGLAGVELVLEPEKETATPGQPCVELTLRFPEAGLEEQRRQSATLTLAVDGEPVKTWTELTLIPGLELRHSLEFSFDRFHPDRDARVTATLTRGSDVLVRDASILLDNYDEEFYEFMDTDPYPYCIHVVRNHNVVIVYGRDGSEEYTVPVQAWLCSTGGATPTGWFNLGRKQVWGLLFGAVWGQYATIITGNILFHSVPYKHMAKDSLKTDYYNRLGSKASMGCVRLPVVGAKWIFDNCPTGTSVYIYDAEELPVKRPTSIILDPSDPRSCWDPTDPDPDNPWLLPEKPAQKGAG